MAGTRRIGTFVSCLVMPKSSKRLIIIVQINCTSYYGNTHYLHLLLSVSHLLQYLANIVINTDGLIRNLPRATGFPEIDTGIDGLRILSGHLSEWILDDTRGSIANPKFQKEDTSVFSCPQEIVVPFCRLVPARILHKRMIRTQVHSHWFSAVGTYRKKL